MILKSTHKLRKTLLTVATLLLFAQISFAQNSADYKKQIDTYFGTGLALKNQNKIEEALEALKTAAEIAERNEDEKLLIDTYHKFALLYLDLDKESNTEFYWARADILLANTEYPYASAVHKFIEAVRLFRRGNNFQAIYMLDDAKQLSNDRNLLNHISLAQADVFLAIEKYESAEKNYNSLLLNNDIYERDYITTKAYWGLSRLYFLQDNLDTSIENAENALKLANKNMFYGEIKWINTFLGELYEKREDYQLALGNVKSLLALKDTLYNIEKVKIESRTGDKITFDIMNEQITKQDAQIEELTESQNRSEIVSILVSAFLIIISLLAVSLYRNNQIKLKTNDLLHTKNRELQTARDSAVLAMEAKTNFLSTVSHELRTPLYAVTGLTHLLLEENPSENQKEHLKSLKFSGDYLLNFINDILQINKIDADKLEPLMIPFNLKKVLTEVINSLQQSAKENKTEILLEYDETIPHNLLGDPLKLSQIFINLVGNGLKFTKNGTVTVIAKLMKKDDEDVTLYFEVKDTGIGISKVKQENIFDSFEQGSIQINREYGGTGLGLTIVKSLLGLFDSKIQLESELGKGSSFFFDLELKAKEGIVEDANFEIADKDYDFKGLHILVVEDNKINQVITKKMLLKKEMSCDIASNGLDAVELAKTNTYDAVLMDIHMPGISGEEATIEIRKFDKETPIIALTAISLDDSLESFYAAGCNDVVTKPFKPEVFYQKIGENIFDKRIVKNPVS